MNLQSNPEKYYTKFADFRFQNIYQLIKYEVSGCIILHEGRIVTLFICFRSKHHNKSKDVRGPF